MEASRRHRRTRLIYEMARDFASELDLDALLPLVMTRCRDALDAEGVSVLLVDRKRNELYFPYQSEDDPAVGARLADLRFPADRGIAGAVLASGRAERVDNPATDPRFYRNVDRRTGVTTRSIIAAPLVARQGAIGVIEAINHRDGPFDDDDLSFLETLAGSVAVAVENANRFIQERNSAQVLRAQVGALRRDLARRELEAEIVGASAAMAQVFQLIQSAAASSIPVLIEGETGTGKELVARAIHRASNRADGPFIAVNCAALTNTLLESELFGHRRGAFTGATSDTPGLFQAADGGVILLDEISEMPLAMQAKLLRVLQQGEVTAVGDTRPRKVDVRVLSATNHDLAAAVAAKNFREDLYYRVAVFPIHMPPLRERRDDIPLLASRFLADSAARHGKRISGLEPAALDALMRFQWPGNVRQLQSEIERAVALAADGQALTLAHLSPALGAASSVAPQAGNAEPPIGATAARDANAPIDPLGRARAAFEKRYIATALGRLEGNVSQTARVLGISRVALYKKMKEHGLC